ncbi:MAG: leucine-rich repeat domain-containing protein [Lachnospiraceae bacterium]|nr:leucine-rich repeat domain-containing protein [Lachnospiraceae bacterium]
MLASWDELVNTYEFDIENTTNENSFRTILSNNSSLSIGVELVISDSVNSIGECAFIGCTGLTSVTIGDSVNSIGEYAFNNCTGLTSITIGDSANSIGEWAFQNCTGLTSVTIGDSVNSIGAAAFANCTGLTSVTIPDSVTSIGASAFLLTELTSVYFEHTTAPTFGTKCFYTSDGDMCTFYFKNSTVGNAFTTDYYNESYGTKSTNYNW